MTRVMAQGTFDLLHPGHIYYLEQSAALGDDLSVVIARDSRMWERKDLVMTEEERRTVVDALRVVDRAVLGSEGSIFESVERLQPDIITLGYDQTFDEAELEQQLAERGFDIQVARIDRYDDSPSSSELRNRVLDQ